MTNDFPDFITEEPVSWDNPSAPGKQEWLSAFFSYLRAGPLAAFLCTSRQISLVPTLYLQLASISPVFLLSSGTATPGLSESNL